MERTNKDASRDLRVFKTKRAIYNALEELLHTKDIDDISVTELARKAEINKGTFYLHYKDIYELYDCFLEESVQRFLDEVDFYPLLFENPKLFLKKLIKYFKMRKKEFPGLNNDKQNGKSPMIFAALMKEEIYATGKIKRSLRNDTAIEFIIYATIALLFSRENSEKNIEMTSEVAAKAIEAFFGDLYDKSKMKTTEQNERDRTKNR